MSKCIVCIIAGLIAGSMIGVGVMALFSPNKIVITDTIGVEKAEYPMRSEYRYDSMRYTQEDGKVIVELVYTKRGASDEQ